MDLTTTYPRSPRDKWQGVVQLGRAIDKGKAVAHGNVGEYHYDCPMDKAVFAFLGIDSAALLDVIRNAKSDAEIEAFTKGFVEKKSPAEIEAWNEDFIANSKPGNDEVQAYFNELLNSIDPSRTDITTWPDLLDLDEKRHVPVRETATA